MRKLFIAVISLFLIQNLLPNSSDKVYFFDCSAAVFRGSEGKDIVELYYAVSQKFLKYSSNGSSGYSADVKLDVSIFNKNSEAPLAVNSYKVPSVVSDTAGGNLKNKIVGQINYEMKYGEYKILVVASDFNNPDRKDSIDLEINAEDFSGSPKMSDIELSTSIIKSSDTKNLFYKNTLEVTPNAAGLYGKNLDEMHYYAEIYNLDADKISDEYTIKRRVLNLNNEEVSVTEKKVKRTGNSRVEFGMLKVDTLKNGSYTLEISIVDPAKNINLVKAKKFYTIIKFDEAVNTDKIGDDILRSEFQTLNEKDLDDLFEKAIYTRTNDEIKTYEQLKTLEAKRKFTFEFWKKRDDIPGTPQNEFKTMSFKRMGEANKLYKESFKDGWKTDRGRIYIIYGAPTEVQRFPFENETKAYEIWIYDNLPGQGSTNTIFIEKETGTGIYTLASSTIRGEMRNDNWQKDLQQFH
jgi:GWxTD domain-containing protein